MDTTDETWQRLIDLNLTAPFRCIRRALPSMTERGFGRVVVVASVVAKRGEPMISAYTASKHGVLGLVRSASREVAAQGVTVNAVCPGYVNTPMTDESIANISPAPAGAWRRPATCSPAGSPTTGSSTRARWRDDPAVRRERRASTARASTSTGEPWSHDPFARSGQPAARSVMRRSPASGHAVAAPWSDGTVHLAGQTALDASGTVVGDGVVEQFERALSNLLTALREAGGAPTDLVSLTVFVVDMDDYRAHAREIGRVWRRLVGRRTRRWRASAWPGSGTPRPSSRCRAPPSSPPTLPGSP